MTNAEKKAAEEAAKLAQGSPANFVDILLKGTKSKISKEAITGMTRGATVVDANIKDFEKMSVGIGQTSLRVGDAFRPTSLRKVKSLIDGRPTESAVFTVENAAGEERLVYINSLTRSTPTQNNEANGNNYDGIVSEDGVSLFDFDRGLMKDFSGSMVQAIEKLVGDGTQFIKIEDKITWSSNILLRDENGKQDPNREDLKRKINQSAYKISLISEAEAKALASN